ncbi:MAG: hypothetical protein B6U95_00355 [Thermofilum sp. ex4484_82]|nr:MAG: hypothetical protein B6U95_00355 [Thermofilum sp. ex4484_82]OYT40067.1 MAG: hypothetical protein B6U96_00360 [Archaeoglobales archaeon ex4484_92]
MSYIKGRMFEYKVKKLLEKKGYFVVRSAGSHFPDLVALKKGEIFLVECKRHDRIKKEEIKALIDLAEKVGGIPILAYKNGNKTLLVKLPFKENGEEELFFD